MSIRGLALSAAAGLMAFGATLVMPGTASAASAERMAIGSTIDITHPVDMQRRGGFRGGPRFAGRPGFRPGPGPYRGRGRGFGPGAALGIGAAALIIGGAAAAASAGPRECWIERRWVEGPYGPERRRIRVCE
jgi:hypothetical protein